MLPSLLHSTSITWPWTLGLGTKESSPKKVKTLGLQLWEKLGVPIVARNSTSDRYPKACSPGICKGVKTYALFSFQILPVSKWGREQVFIDGKRYVATLLCKWNQVCALTGDTDESIRQFLKPTGHQQLEVVGVGPTWSTNQQTVALLKRNLLMIHVKNQD